MRFLSKSNGSGETVVRLWGKFAPFCRWFIPLFLTLHFSMERKTFPSRKGARWMTNLLAGRRTCMNMCLFIIGACFALIYSFTLWSNKKNANCSTFQAHPAHPALVILGVHFGVRVMLYIYIFVYLQYTVLYTDMLYSPFLKRTQTQHKTKPWQSPGEHHHIVVLEHRRMSNGICVWYLCLCVAWPHWGETSAQRKEACYHVEACKTHGCVKQFETHQSCVKWSWNGRNSLGYM